MGGNGTGAAPRLPSWGWEKWLQRGRKARRAGRKVVWRTRGCLPLPKREPATESRPSRGCRPPGAAGCAPGRWRGSSDRDNPQAGLVDAELETRRVGLPDTTASEETGTLTASPVVGHGGDRNSARVGARCQLGGRRRKRAWALPEPARGVGDLAACCPPPGRGRLRHRDTWAGAQVSGNVVTRFTACGSRAGLSG